MSSSSSKKVKVLLFGCVNDQITTFVTKVTSLQKSKAGPFDVCFCVGSFHVPVINSPEYDLLQSSLPLPVYLQDAVLSSTTTDDDVVAPEEEITEIQTLIEPHLKAFPSEKSNMYNIVIPTSTPTPMSLVVASCPRTLRLDDTVSVNKSLLEKVHHVSYVGCDLLLTSHWPQGMESLCVENHAMTLQAQRCATYDVAEIALKARARYHVVPAATTYWQSPPFAHWRATTSTVTPKHTGRLIALGMVVVATKKPTPSSKFVHALGIVPLHSMNAQDLQQSSSGMVAPCPFTDESYTKVGGNNNSNNNNQRTVGGLSEAQARRIIAEGNGQHSQRWNLNPRNNNNKNKKRPNDHKEGNDEEPVDPSNMTLFVHGLHRDVSGQLQLASDPTLLGAFRHYGATKVRRPPNATTTSFAFIEFDSHAQAKLCLETLGGETTINGVHVTIKWGKTTTTNTNNNSNNSNKRPRLTEAEAHDSSTLYFRLPPSVAQNPDAVANASEQVRKWMEVTLEDALNEEGTNNRVTAAEEPALQVKLRRHDNNKDGGQLALFGFLDFASHAAASMALATLTGSTDGGIVINKNPKKEDTTNDKDNDKTEEAKVTDDMDVVQQEEEGKKVDAPVVKTKQGEKTNISDATESGKGVVTENDTSCKPQEDSIQTEPKAADSEDATSDNKPLHKVWNLVLHWARGSVERTEKTEQLIQDANCDFQFQRQHFPADARKDCWFCLASEGCEKHLITGVYQQCYAAMPKGPMHKGHVLLIPVAHSSQGAFFDRTVSQEIRELQQALRLHAREEYDMDLVVFERAIQTRGGYHTHVQCVPVPKGLGVKLETTLRAQGQANQFEFREIQSPDLDISTLLRQDDDNDSDGGYFYVEVPMPGSKLEFKRFLYKVQAQQEGRGPRVPLQFGREVIAAVMGKKELAHWKSCQVDKEEETKMAVDLRQSFEKYYG
jgi:diadenosine tetraphosphate (Ap4A) HIT family hydrolase